MSFWDKVKSFGSKIVKGIRKGVDWVKEKIFPVVKRVAPVVGKVAPAIGGLLGRPDVGMAISKGADKAVGIVNALGG